MESPFIYGKMAESEFFIDREKETTQLLGNFKSLVNTALISPRRWGKTSLVNKTLEMLAKDKGYYAACIDIFNCRTEEEMEELRKLEHERNLRYYKLHNFRYGPRVDDDARLNPMVKRSARGVRLTR